jgi:chromosome segregation protein
VRDDYSIELAELAQSIDPHGTDGASAEDITERPAEAVFDREAMDREIAELRRKVSNVGSVNLAALDEIDELQARHDSLAAQYRDLTDAKDSLVRIIHRINADSRRLFTETLESIRINFQRLFRRVFGGGHADIVLEEGLDILEAGIEIVATPPGKHSLGISLLSGGERALTAVTLLLAIFEYRPSPFCVLDEVDGPLDEANIGRFTDVLRDFLSWTKFIVVTHSKKTMTAATTLYGITMQESGVSKQVSVQFDDVSDDGHISRAAIERSDAEARRRDNERGVA